LRKGTILVITTSPHESFYRLYSIIVSPIPLLSKQSYNRDITKV